MTKAICRMSLLSYSGAPVTPEGVVTGSTTLTAVIVEWEVFDVDTQKKIPCADGQWVRQEALPVAVVAPLPLQEVWDDAVDLVKLREGIL